METKVHARVGTFKSPANSTDEKWVEELKGLKVKNTPGLYVLILAGLRGGVQGDTTAPVQIITRGEIHTT